MEIDLFCTWLQNVLIKSKFQYNVTNVFNVLCLPNNKIHCKKKVLFKSFYIVYKPQIVISDSASSKHFKGYFEQSSYACTLHWCLK